MTTTVWKAQQTGGVPVPNLEIVATSELPEHDLRLHQQQLDRDAGEIVKAMLASLPQGTLGRVFAKLAQHYATDFAVAYERIGKQQ